MASVFLGDLSDFIEPSQSCVNPLFTGSGAAAADDDGAAPAQSGGAKLVLDFEGPDLSGLTAVKPDLIKPTKGKKAQVSLTDCLACSGCVTSAETVLISQQSTMEFLAALQAAAAAAAAAASAAAGRPQAAAPTRTIPRRSP